jgi:hypothetical protein
MSCLQNEGNLNSDKLAVTERERNEKKLSLNTGNPLTRNYLRLLKIF